MSLFAGREKRVKTAPPLPGMGRRSRWEAMTAAAFTTTIDIKTPCFEIREGVAHFFVPGSRRNPERRIPLFLCRRGSVPR